ncbi:uncharacterized protein LACBIDRAFT_314648 [Laccaria bicolor S238N-H82]|uniref:Predicted protein n=1 Tax=Laccaria bicolor (strain S238N-H82 / ATCC MYA-4686) TaxID=486041 RepID=B0DYY8_LACBS|nr:uncharacterized protein LACBIDRAFT_314648 [Laccaria bicolor S238N-H82]EDR00247.1 predicted protein [Laccaria bicolor S238N-H82]|eukprot:XP_001889156.1 predicted protein [Laccaria bicolor S238N-H82]
MLSTQIMMSWRAPPLCQPSCSDQAGSPLIHPSSLHPPSAHDGLPEYTILCVLGVSE